MSTLKKKSIPKRKPSVSTGPGKRSLAYYEAEARKVEVPMTEQLLPRGHFVEKFSDEDQETIWKKGEKERTGISRKKKKMLYEGMRKLSDGHRKCIVADSWDGLSLQETARKLGVSKSTVSRRKKKAVEELKEYIESKGKKNESK